ncbi:hypothetical protein Tco_0702775, partial [Tanacetum coccineum]
MTHIPLRPNLWVLQIGIKSQEDSMVPYTEVSSLFEDLSDIGSSGLDGLPMMPEDLYAYEDEEDPEEDPADYPVDKGDDDDESSDDDEDDDDVKEDEDQEEHLALADSVPSPAYRTTARMSIRLQTPVP